MITLLLSFLALAANNEFPQMSYVIVSSAFSHKDIEKMEDWKEHKDELIDACENDYTHLTTEQRDKCESYINSISSIILSDGSDINKKLAKVSKKTEVLFYMVHTRHTNVDFNNLPGKMAVYMLPINISRHRSNNNDISKLISKITKKLIISSFNGSQESNLRFSQFNSKGDNNRKYTEVIIEGSISNKVSYLTISNLRIVYNHEFKCENLYISSAVLVSKSNSPAHVNNFLIDTETFSYYSILPYLVADQFTLVDIHTQNYSVPEYQVAYYDLFIGIQYTYDGNFTHNRYYWKVPYTVAKKFSLICYSQHIVIEAVNKDLDKYPDINLTVTDKGLIESPIIPHLFSLDKIFIESKGFDLISKKIWPSIVVTYNKLKFSLDKSKSDLDVKGESIYSYKPKSHGVSTGVIVAIVAVIVIIIIIITIVIVVMRKKKERRDAAQANEIYEKNLLNDDQVTNQNQFSNNYHDPVPESPYLQQKNDVYYPNPPYAPPPYAPPPYTPTNVNY